MANVAASYSSKSTAIRGGKRAGMENPVAYQDDNGRWYVSDASEVLGPEDNFEMSEAELAEQKGRESADIARDTKLIETIKGAKGLEPGVHTVQVTKVRKARGKNALKIEMKVVDATTKGQDEGTAIAKKAAEKGLSYKQLPRLAKSEVEKPLNVIHSFLDANPTLKRKEAVTALVNMGINFYTARTQYQKWYSKKAAK